METFMEGRALLLEEIPEEWQNQVGHAIKRNTIQTYPGFTIQREKKTCARCGTENASQRYEGPCSCGAKCVYCLACIQMGKVAECRSLYWMPARPLTPKMWGDSTLKWGGQLSTQQKDASAAILNVVKTNQKHVVWAVAGAGKTEMLFEGIDHALREGKRVCVASPRVDVCLELAPRFAAAFPSIPLIVLHGEMDEAYRYTQFVVATTHQLLRFKEAFDLLVIDEVDAFPFHLNDALQFGAEKARKKTSSLLYLTATPDRRLQREIKHQKITASILPARYHGHPLPVPVCKWVGNWKKVTKNPLVLSPALRWIKKWLALDRRFLIFIPNIEWMYAFETVCRKAFPDISFSAVSSEDPLRKEKVLSMRREEFRFLLTTTILERGVTFPNIHVLVLGAEDETFTESALVQISGRAGRSPLFPTGDVVFLHSGQTKAMKKAIRQIRHMNHLARKNGYLLHD